MKLRPAAAALALAVLAVFPAAATAYEIDVHFYLTYVLARLAGLPDPQAALVARADQSQDDNTTTTAFKFPFPPLHYRRNGMRWHAFNENHERVMQRFLELQCRAGVSRAFDRGVESVCPQPAAQPEAVQLVALGQFLHFYEDTYAHSKSAELNSAWVPYGAMFGHLFEGIQPDLIPNRPALAQLMAWEVFGALRTFATEHGETAAVYPDRAQIDLLVAAVASAYRDDHGDPPPADGTGRVNHYRAADLSGVRCALSAAVERSGLLPSKPDVRDVGYTKLAFDDAGDPQPSPPQLAASLATATACAGDGLVPGNDE